jgi:hypothetical protein
LCASDFEPDVEGSHLLRGKVAYYHYEVDSFDDRGWGCGYRTVQSMLSWVAPDRVPPSIPEMQALLNSSDRKAWIGVQEAVTLLDMLHGAVVEVLPLASGDQVLRHLPRLAAHFDGGGGPIMIGGGLDVYSKTVIGVRISPAPAVPEMLVLDPHYVGRSQISDLDDLREGGWISWKPMSMLSAESFYNLAMPRSSSLKFPSQSSSASSPTNVEVLGLRVGDARMFPTRTATDWSLEIEVVQSGDESHEGPHGIQ